MTTETTKVLNSDQRRFLDAQTQRAREAAQRAAEDALRALAVAEPSRPGYLSDEQNKLRLALRDKARQLGDDTARAGAPLTNLVHDVAYEQWHRLLFARFLEVNGLLRHPDYRDIPLSLEDCGDLAPDLGEPDAWAVAARFASEILPGVFRLTDPAIQVQFAAEHRAALESLLLDIPTDVFTTEDALGWVYQFWQTAEKKRVNESGVKIGGADLSPVTQLFTENYMVRFLLENSLGAWWAARHPSSALLAGWEYLRRNEDGTPAAGSFSDWPDRAADVTVMDPCCGSGHFLVAMFGMLWRMRAEEEGLTPAEAQDAVLRDNLHGLELDPRCTQIATFNVALEAWKQGGFRDLPAPQIACSGIPVRGKREDWEALAENDVELRGLLGRLHGRFREADTLGSLIDPRPSTDGDALVSRDMTVDVGWDRVRLALQQAIEVDQDAATVLGHAAEDVVNAAALLGGVYTLVATNPPFLNDQKMEAGLYNYCAFHFPDASAELAVSFVERAAKLVGPHGTIAIVLPSTWLTLRPYLDYRKRKLKESSIRVLANLGPGAFSGLTGEVVKPVLMIQFPHELPSSHATIDVADHPVAERPSALASDPLLARKQDIHLGNPNSAIAFRNAQGAAYLSDYCTSHLGISTGDNNRFVRKFWEFPMIDDRWDRLTGTVGESIPYGGRDEVLLWESGAGKLYDFITERLGEGRQGTWIRGKNAWRKDGISLSRAGKFPSTLYSGTLFLDSPAVFIPSAPEYRPAIWHFVQSEEYRLAVRAINQKVIATVSTMVKVPFDLERWQAVAEASEPLPDAVTDDPTQWLFRGDVASSGHPLQVAVARLLGYMWPESHGDSLDGLSDSDGIAALMALPGEPDLATRLRELLARAYGMEWSSALERKLVIEAGGKNGRLEDWLRDSFFGQHVKLYDNRPFLWHIWDGRKDGFSAIVNYHRLDRRTLEKLTFTALGAWIDRQKHEARAERPGADARLAAAEELQRRLQLILGGEPPYDVYVRWKEMADQPIGWEPDVDDGVRLNIRPFVTADVLRSKVNVHWRKDRGTNPDGSERHNDLHPTLEERRAARREAGDAK